MLKDLLTLAHLSNAGPVDTPMELNVKYSKDNGGPLLDATMYRCLVGILTYLTMTHPHIAYDVKVVSQFVDNPHKNHLTAVPCILRVTFVRQLYLDSFILLIVP